MSDEEESQKKEEIRKLKERLKDFGVCYDDLLLDIQTLEQQLSQAQKEATQNKSEKNMRLLLQEENQVLKERVDSLEKENKDLKEKVRLLEIDSALGKEYLKNSLAREYDLMEKHAQQQQQIAEQQQQIAELQKQVAELLKRKSPGTVTSASGSPSSSSSNAGIISSMDSAAAPPSLGKQLREGNSLNDQLHMVDGKQSTSHSNDGQTKGSDVFDVDVVGLALEELGANKFTGMSLHEELSEMHKQELAVEPQQLEELVVEQNKNEEQELAVQPQQLEELVVEQNKNEEQELAVQPQQPKEQVLVVEELVLRQNMQNSMMENEKSAELDAVTWSLKGQSIAVLKIDIPCVEENTLNEAVSNDLRKAFADIKQDSLVRGVVLISGKPNSFMAGADIAMLSRYTTAEAAEGISRDAKVLFDFMENSEKPIVAAISGSCMGAGLEMALACHYRIAVNSPKTQFALPEVTLGLLPSGGGTQRLPKLISLQNALDMMLTGKVIRSDEAKNMGFVNHLIQPLGAELTDPISRTHRFLEKIAISTCEQLAAGTLKPKRKRTLMGRVQNLLPNAVIRVARDKVMKQTHDNYPAPLRILDVIHTGLLDGLQEGYKRETEEFGRLTQTTQSQALIGLFKGKSECKENKYGVARKTKRIAVIGAGPLGAAIALVSIEKGIETILVGTSQVELDRAFKQITTQMEGRLKRKKFTSADHAIFLTELRLVLDDYAQLHEVDVVVEAEVEAEPEDVEQKRKLVQKLENVVPAHCIIALNTSALSICDIAAEAQRPARVIGMRYFLTVDEVELLEIIVAENTSDETIAVAATLGLDLNKRIVFLRSDGDVVSVFGLGFPSFWGGPFRFVDLHEAKNLVDEMKRYKEIHPGVTFQPCQLLLDYAKSD